MKRIGTCCLVIGSDDSCLGFGLIPHVLVIFLFLLSNIFWIYMSCFGPVSHVLRFRPMQPAFFFLYKKKHGLFYILRNSSFYFVFFFFFSFLFILCFSLYFTFLRLLQFLSKTSFKSCRHLPQLRSNEVMF